MFEKVNIESVKVIRINDKRANCTIRHDVVCVVFFVKIFKMCVLFLEWVMRLTNSNLSSRTALNVGVILVQIWCNTLCNDTHDIHDIARNHTIKLRYHTIFYDIHDIKRRCQNSKR